MNKNCCPLCNLKLDYDEKKLIYFCIICGYKEGVVCQTENQK
jgi:uncharacterized protein YbaR (Trm112 family)